MQSFKQVFDDYQIRRNSNLTEYQFISLLSTFPAILVSMADNNVDRLEEKHLESVAQSLSLSFAEDGLSLNESIGLGIAYFSEFKYLIDNLDSWKEIFLNLITEYLQTYPEQKIHLENLIIAAAESSEGISNEEQQVINELKAKFQL